jgi:ubiquinol-cytochrome c reductase cytochrome b subunit
MKALIGWIDDRIGLVSAMDRQLDRPLKGGASWRYVLPGTLLFAFLVEVITGLVLWASYSPSAQTAWESVYWFQEVTQAGWLVRGIHFFAGHAMVVLAGLYVAQLVLTGMYRAPREFLFWAAVLMLLVLLGLLLTGDLLRWDQEGYWATRVRVGFLTLIPKIGGDAVKLVLGGSDFGHLTLTRFVVLHVGVLSLAFAILVCWHNRMLARAGLPGREKAVAGGPGNKPAGDRPQSYWPGQALRNLLAAIVLSAVVGLLCVQNYWRGPHTGQRPGEYLGAPLGAPADPIDSFAAARPEWAFRPLYQLAGLFKSSTIGNTGLSWQIVPIFGITSGLVLLVFLMPVVGKLAVGHRFNVALLLAIVAGAVGLGAMSVWSDRRDAKYQSASTFGEETARLARELVRPPLEGSAAAGAQSGNRAAASLASPPDGIPAGGALALVHSDHKMVGRALFHQHCASCHNYTDAEGRGVVSEKPSAPNLYGFGSRPWLAGLFDPQKIVGPDYYGNTALHKGEMIGFVKDTFSKMEADEKKQLETAIAALSSGATLPSQRDLDEKEKSARIAEGKKLLLSEYTCTDCHRYGGKGQLGNGPDLVGWGSREWLVGLISNPAHQRFYGKKNDRMPAYAEAADEPDKNVLSPAAIGILADWLRGEWYEPEKGGK